MLKLNLLCNHHFKKLSYFFPFTLGLHSGHSFLPHCGTQGILTKYVCVHFFAYDCGNTNWKTSYKNSLAAYFWMGSKFLCSWRKRYTQMLKILLGWIGAKFFQFFTLIVSWRIQKLVSKKLRVPFFWRYQNLDSVIGMQEYLQLLKTLWSAIWVMDVLSPERNKYIPIFWILLGLKCTMFVFPFFHFTCGIIKIKSCFGGSLQIHFFW